MPINRDHGKEFFHISMGTGGNIKKADMREYDMGNKSIVGIVAKYYNHITMTHSQKKYSTKQIRAYQILENTPLT